MDHENDEGSLGMDEELAMRVLDLQQQLDESQAEVRKLKSHVETMRSLMLELQRSALMENNDEGLAEAGDEDDECVMSESEALETDPLVIAARGGKSSIVSLLLNELSCPRDIVDRALLAACQHGHLEVAEQLVTIGGADVHVDFDMYVRFVCHRKR